MCHNLKRGDNYNLKFYQKSFEAPWKINGEFFAHILGRVQLPLSICVPLMYKFRTHDKQYYT